MAEPVRILLARPDHLGDVLLTLPAVRALRDALPGARISYLVPPQVADVPRHCPWIDEVLTLPFPDPTAPPAPPRWLDLIEGCVGDVRGRFDVALLFRPRDPWSGALVARAGIPVRLGFEHPETRPFLTAALPVPDRRHVALMALDLVALAVGGGATKPGNASLPGGPHFLVTPVEEAEADDALADIPDTRDAQPRGAFPIVLHPGSGWRLKNWPPDRWGRLASALRARFGTPPLVVGGPAEGDLVSAVSEASEGAAVRLRRPLSLGGLAALHRRAGVVIATDSGPLHLAAMVGTPVVGLYGPFGPDLFAPLAGPGRYRALTTDLPCSPCGTLVDPPCGAVVSPACVMGIGVQRVADAIGELLADVGATGPDAS